MILPVLKGKLCLQEQIVADNKSALDCRRDGFPNRCLVVMPPLVGRIDPTKPLSQSQFGQPLSVVFFPCRSVEELRNWNTRDLRILLQNVISDTQRYKIDRPLTFFPSEADSATRKYWPPENVAKQVCYE